ncbi:hypothetical protein ACFQY0_13035 [Haloferula chungangensis]|uniref:Oligosaccharide repeat unit polymerase n=1 Tax=Haloferula chungangensis TaxID=1048331 RepID=A0ABW2L9K4_9BACT
MEQDFQFPLPFFLSVLALAGFAFMAFKNRDRGWGLPMGVVLATTAVWYHGDALYNDYQEYIYLMGESALESGWWQVLIFIVSFGLLVSPVHQLINAKLVGKKSNLMVYFRTRRLEHPAIQQQIDKLTMALAVGWLLLMSVALVRVDFNFVGLFAPYLERKVDPWMRGRVGGSFDAVISLAGYLHVFLAAGFGVLAAVARNPKARTVAITICILTFPFFIFDRTRNTMLATMLPGILAWILFRVKGGLVVKGAVLLGAFMLINFWFSFVLANRNDQSISTAFKNDEAIKAAEETKHEGLSMFSELGYMNSFFEQGTLEPNWGERYFAELVNPIPRGLWKDKPFVGVDYAIARGFGWDKAGGTGAGIAASIATGMIGQGVVNFGGLFGPMAAALLMAIWVAVLARQDLLGSDPARLLLYASGMILTFNMGRDITLLVLYPFVFGLMLLIARDLILGRSPEVQMARPPRRRKVRKGTERDASPKTARGNKPRRRVQWRG